MGTLFWRLGEQRHSQDHFRSAALADTDILRWQGNLFSLLAWSLELCLFLEGSPSSLKCLLSWHQQRCIKGSVQTALLRFLSSFLATAFFTPQELPGQSWWLCILPKGSPTGEIHLAAPYEKGEEQTLIKLLGISTSLYGLQGFYSYGFLFNFLL